MVGFLTIPARPLAAAGSQPALGAGSQPGTGHRCGALGRPQLRGQRRGGSSIVQGRQGWSFPVETRSAMRSGWPPAPSTGTELEALQVHRVHFPAVSIPPSTGLRWCFHPLPSPALGRVGWDPPRGGHWLAAAMSRRWVRGCSASLCSCTSASRLRISISFSIPGKRGRSGSGGPTRLAPPSAAKLQPVGKSPAAFLPVERWGNSSGTAEKIPPSETGRGWCLTPTRVRVAAHLPTIASATLPGHGRGSQAGISPSTSGLAGSGIAPFFLSGDGTSRLGGV